VHGTGVYSAGVGPKDPALERFLDIKKKKKKKKKVLKTIFMLLNVLIIIGGIDPFLPEASHQYSSRALYILFSQCLELAHYPFNLCFSGLVA
jgi:hypothetical protein